jgi:hypothetical protein
MVPLSKELQIGPPVFTGHAATALVMTRRFKRYPSSKGLENDSVTLGLSDDEARALLRFLIERYPLDAIGGI